MSIKMKRAILLGDSPFLKEVEDKVQYVLDRWYSVGINRVITRFRTNAHVFVDPFLITLTNQYPNLFTVSLAKYGDMILKENKSLSDTYTFNFLINTVEDIKKKGQLAWCGFTHDYALSYLISEGYNNIILLGAADFSSNMHYSNPYELKCSEKLKAKSKKFIEEICCKKVTILTCNSNSYLNIPRINIDELLV